MPFFLASGGLLVRELAKRGTQMERNGVPMATRGLFTTTRRPIKRRTKTFTQERDPFSASELRKRMGGFSARRNRSDSASQQLHEDESGSWIPVYRFGKIGICALIARAKFYQTVISVGFVPYATYKMCLGDYSVNTYFASLGLALLAPLVLIAFANTFNRLVGVVSFNPEQQVVRFGYLSFWGRRQNKTVSVDSVIPLSDCYSLDEKKLLLKLQFTENVEVVEQELARMIFGNLKLFEVDEDLEDSQ